MTQQLFNLQLIDLITTFSESPFLTCVGPINFPHVENWQTFKGGIPSLMHVEFKTELQGISHFRQSVISIKCHNFIF